MFLRFAGKDILPVTIVSLPVFKMLTLCFFFVMMFTALASLAMQTTTTFLIHGLPTLKEVMPFKFIWKESPQSQPPSVVYHQTYNSFKDGAGSSPEQNLVFDA